MPDGTGRYLVGGLLALLGAIGVGIAFALSGLYNVSAAREHLDVTTWILDVVRRSSVRTQSLGIQAPPLDEPGMAGLGAAYFEYGCLPCHGAPGRQPSPVAGGMLPDPPSLTSAAVDWSTEELFWIIHNGQKYTGMPAWLDFRREDEVWPLVAFMKTLPETDPAEYAALARTPGAGAATDGFLETPQIRTVDICTSCHGPSVGRPVNARVPRLQGQSAAYLQRALREYAEGQRPSGMMELFAAPLSDTEIASAAEYYAGGAAAGEQIGTPASGDAERGAEIFSLGIPGRGVPACNACHVVAQNPQFPRLEGLPAAYVRRQLLVFKEGLRDGSGYGAIMTRVASRLTGDEIADVAVYIENLPTPAKGSGTP
jgi:cytochrome c553